MTQREQRLAIAVAAAGVVWFGLKGVDRYRAAVASNDARQRSAAAELEDAEFAEARGERARRQLNQWRERSLPADRDIAKSLYHDWLRTELAAAGLAVEQLAEKPAGRSNPHYGELADDVRATGTLAQLVDFLYKFYSAPHLHRINSAAITASDAGAKLTAALVVEGLVLPGADRFDQLAEAEPQSLPQPLDELRTSLVDRNIFAPHAGKSGASSGDDEASRAFVRMFTYGEGGWAMTIRVDNPDRVRHFHAGDSIAFGKFTGDVVEIDGRRAVIKTDDGLVEVRLGQHLGEATPLPDGNT